MTITFTDTRDTRFHGVAPFTFSPRGRLPAALSAAIHLHPYVQPAEAQAAGPFPGRTA
jgi:hypothetical protein